MAFSAKVLADSVSPAGHRLTTLEVVFPRIVLAEFNTHRALSRNSASSRAVPVKKRIADVAASPFIPEQFGKNQSGMQASVALGEQSAQMARLIWEAAAESAVDSASQLAGMEVHKQLANRVLEPFSWHTVIVTATEWENYFALRVSPFAQPEISRVSELMQAAMAASVPQLLQPTEWHLPLVDARDAELSLADRIRVSCARCARVSYLTHDGVRDPQKDIDLYETLASRGHMSPLEHVARPMDDNELDDYSRWDIETRSGRRFSTRHDPRALIETGRLVEADVAIMQRTHFCGNFNGWVQHRKELPGESVFRG